jgi:hypothetical protein
MRCKEKTILPPGGVVDVKTNIYLKTLADEHPNNEGLSLQHAGENADSLHDALNQFVSAKVELDADIQDMETSERVITENMMTEQDRIRRTVQIYADALRQQENKLIDIVSLEAGRKLHEIRQKLSDARKRTANLTSIENVSSAVDNAQAANYLSSNTTLIHLLQKLNRTSQELLKEPSRYSTIIFDPRRIETIPNLGRVLSSVQLESDVERTLTDFVSANRIHLARGNEMLCVCDHFKFGLVIYRKIDGHYTEIQRRKNVNCRDAIINKDASVWVARWSSVTRYESKEMDTYSVLPSNDREITGCISLANSDRGDVFVGDYVQSRVRRYDLKAVLVKTYETSVRPFSIHVAKNSYLVISDWEAGRVVAIDLSSGEEMLKISVVPNVQATCYHEKSDCLLVTRFDRKSSSDSGVIEQYSFQTGRFVARIAQRLYRPKAVALDSDDTLIVADGKNVIFMKIV